MQLQICPRTDEAPVPPRLVRRTCLGSVSRCGARRAFNGCKRKSRVMPVGFGGDSLTSGEQGRRLSRQVTPQLAVAGNRRRRARGQPRCLGTGTAGAGARIILPLRGFRLGDRPAIARIEQTQIDQGRGAASAFHPGMIAAATSLRGQDHAQNRRHEPCHGG